RIAVDLLPRSGPSGCRVGWLSDLSVLSQHGPVVRQCIVLSDWAHSIAGARVGVTGAFQHPGRYRGSFRARNDPNEPAKHQEAMVAARSGCFSVPDGVRTPEPRQLGTCLLPMASADQEQREECGGSKGNHHNPSERCGIMTRDGYGS